MGLVMNCQLHRVIDTVVVSVSQLKPRSSDFGDICAWYSPFLHQHVCVGVVCGTHKLHRDRINLELFRSLDKGGWWGTREGVWEHKRSVSGVNIGVGRTLVRLYRSLVFVHLHPGGGAAGPGPCMRHPPAPPPPPKF